MAYTNERFAPELLMHRDELVRRVRASVDEQQDRIAELKAKQDAAIAKQKEQQAARAAAVAAEKAARDAEKAAKYGATTASTTAPKKKDFGTVERVSSRAERIAARKAAGGDAPSLFGL